MIFLENIFCAFPEFDMNFTLSVSAGEKIGLIGPSGSGKTTLLHLMAGFAFADNGRIFLNGKDHTRTLPHQRPVSMLFQENNLFEHLSVAENMGLGLRPNLKLSRKQQEDLCSIACSVGLQSYLSRMPSQLSGGQKQRVALARCLLRDQPILLLDEPFSALDKPLRQEMLALLEDMYQQKKLTIIMVTHQPEELNGFASRFIRLGKGHLVS